MACRPAFVLAAPLRVAAAGAPAGARRLSLRVAPRCRPGVARRPAVVAQVGPSGGKKGKRVETDADEDDVMTQLRSAASRVASPATVDAVSSAVEGATSKLPPSVTRAVGGAASRGGGGVYVAAQVALVAAIVFKFPGGGVIDGALWLAVGPAALLAGVALMAKAVADLQMDNLSPLPIPVDGGKLITSGVYAYVRHPMYSGLLLACAGLSIGSGSLERIALTALLGVVLAKKVGAEEVALAKAYRDYEAYAAKVPWKLLPKVF